jgi:TetR/AcrR family transcriptional regulator
VRGGRPRRQPDVRGRTQGSRSASATRLGPQERGERTRRRILEAAEELFSSHGYAGTSLDAIAEQVGMHQPGIFYYFPDKWTLYEAVVSGALRAFETRSLAALTTERSAEQRLLGWANIWVEELAARPSLANLILRESANPDPRSMPGIIAEVGQRAQRRVRDLVREIRPDVSNDDVFYLQSAIAGTTLFYATALQRLISGGAESDMQHSIDRFKRLLGKTIRHVLREIRSARP